MNDEPERIIPIDALKAADAWLERWAVHVGNCRGGELCECGLTRIRYEIALAIEQNELTADSEAMVAAMQREKSI